MVFGRKTPTEKVSGIVEAKKHTDIQDRKELEEIVRITERLDHDEIVAIVAKQSRVKPGGSKITTPNIIFVTDRRMIIRNPTMLGMRENIEDFSYDTITGIKLEKGMLSSTIVITIPGMGGMSRIGRGTGLLAWGRGEDGSIDAIPKDKAEKILEYVRGKIEQSKINKNKHTIQQVQSQADDPLKILKVRYAKGEITKEEYDDMKSALE